MKLRFVASTPITVFPSHRRCMEREFEMSKERPTDDPRDQNDWGSHRQTDKPWKGNPEKEQGSDKVKPDLEKWHETKTH